MICQRHTIRRVLIVVLASFCLPIADVSGDEEAAKSRYGHEFPKTFDLENLWKEFERENHTSVIAQKLLQESAKSKHMVRRRESTFTSSWMSINLWLKQHAEKLAAVRIAENAAAPTALYVAKRSGDPARLLTTYRTYPWADPVHKSQIETAEQLLRSGEPHLALRYYEDVLQRSEDAALQVRAQAGRWLAAAHLADSPDDVVAMFRDIEPNTLYPWFGKQVPAREIQAKLTAGMKPARPYANLSSLSVRTIQLPDDPPWMRLAGSSDAVAFRYKVQPVVSSQGTVVAGPCLVAWYPNGTLDAPTWSNIATMDIASTIPGVISSKPPFDPLVAEGRIYVRCGSDIAPSDQKRTRVLAMTHEAPRNFGFLNQLSAFDQHSGRKLWSAADDPAWADFFAVNAPVYSDGRLYLLAMLRKAVVPGGGQVLLDSKAPIFLVILDAATGHVLHKRELVAFRTTFQKYESRGQSRPPRKIGKPNLSADASLRGPGGGNQMNQYGIRLTLHDGAVYASTNMGAAARCDSRDGLIEWVATYPQISTNSKEVLVPHEWPHAWDAAFVINRRHAIAPLVSGDVVVLSPRDTVAVFALDRETGAQLWQKLHIEDEDEAAKESDEATPAPASPPVEGPADEEVHHGSLEALGLIGDSVLVTFDRRIAALDLATGKVRWTQTLSTPVERPVKVVGKTLYLATAMDLMQIDGATGKIIATRALTPLRTDNGFVFDEEGLIIVKPGKNGITCYGMPEEKPQ